MNKQILAHIEEMNKEASCSHSSYLALRGQKVVAKQPYGSCYSEITYSSSMQANRLYVFFGEEAIKQAKNPEAWANWVINSDMFGGAFITKDASEGLKFGFEVNTKAERILMQGGMMALRRPFEFSYFSWWDFVELGYDEYEAYALATNIKVFENLGVKFMVYDGANCNHLVILRAQNLAKYRGSGYKPEPLYGTLYTGFKDYSCQSSIQHWGCTEKDSWDKPFCVLKNTKDVKQETIEIGTPFSTKIKGYAFNKSNVDKVLQYMKGLK